MAGHAAEAFEPLVQSALATNGAFGGGEKADILRWVSYVQGADKNPRSRAPLHYVVAARLGAEIVGSMVPEDWSDPSVRPHLERGLPANGETRWLLVRRSLVVCPGVSGIRPRVRRTPTRCGRRRPSRPPWGPC
jgi:hypothetical protein